MLEWLTPAERRGATVLVVILLVGAARDAWQARPRATASSPSVPTIDARDIGTDAKGAPQPSDPAEAGPRADRRLDLNQAGEVELEALPGIGPVLAARIVAQRARLGPFRRVDDLLGVRGIGPRLFAKLEPLLTVGPGPRSGAPSVSGAVHSAPSPRGGRADSTSVEASPSR